MNYHNITNQRYSLARGHLAPCLCRVVCTSAVGVIINRQGWTLGICLLKIPDQIIADPQ